MADTRIPFSNGNSIDQLTSNSTLVFDNATASMSVGGATVTSAQLALRSVTQGFLPNSGTTTEKDNIVTPEDGLMFYDTTLKAYFFYNGTSMSWEQLGGSGGGSTIASVSGDWENVWAAPIAGGIDIISTPVLDAGTPSGQLITLNFGIVNDTANTSDVIVFTVQLDAPYRPATTYVQPVSVIDNGDNVLGLATVTLSGDVSVAVLKVGGVGVFVSTDAESFVGAGNTGWTTTLNVSYYTPFNP